MTKIRYEPEEIKLFKKLNSAAKIQDFLETLRANFEKRGETCMSPRRVVRTGMAHCMEGALLAAAVLEFHGHKPLVVDLRSAKPHDDDHVVAVFRQFGCWGAVSKTNHAVLRYREPVYKTLRELVMSYFHEYFLDNGKKTLREYSLPFNVRRFDRLRWRTSERDLFEIPEALDAARHFPVASPAQMRNFRKADPIEIAAGKLVQHKK
ncbi:MAG TPA: hypothetical protein VHA30_03755 [Patescibacteria group bacterium]|nr:hypothetical protein [Patescibacteria group bacterium]